MAKCQTELEPEAFGQVVREEIVGHLERDEVLPG